MCAENPIFDGADLLAKPACVALLVGVLCLRRTLHLLLGILSLFSDCLRNPCSDKQTGKP